MIDFNHKRTIRNKAIAFLSKFGEDIKTKFTNICGKTGQYDVPSELFQKRTSRANRVLLSWKSVRNNNLSIEQLNSFEGGVVVEFVNEDLFLEENQNNTTFIELKHRLGGDENVSSMISIRSESGSSSSQNQRDAFAKLINKTKLIVKNEEITITESNYQEFAIKRVSQSGMGNSHWNGFLFVSIKGGQQDTIETHNGENCLLFNPACEYANKKVCLDIDFVVIYFALHSIDENSLQEKNKKEFSNIKESVESYLNEAEYSHIAFSGNLLEYCKNHPCLRMYPGYLYDPIQVKQIRIEDFSVKNKEDERNLDFTHNEAVNKDKFYWDSKQNCILTPARPDNIFWSKHLSNMMQQNFSLEEYFDYEAKIVERRKSLLNR